MVAVFAAKNLFGQDFEKSSDVTTDTIAGFVQGLMSFPLNIPGTRFYKCMKDKDKLEKVIRAMLKERIACPEEKKGDFFVLTYHIKYYSCSCKETHFCKEHHYHTTFSCKES
ncbi:hypothetical protein CsSME_00031825 [Camellia sinensis var. sinensis]